MKEGSRRGSVQTGVLLLLTLAVVGSCIATRFWWGVAFGSGLGLIISSNLVGRLSSTAFPSWETLSLAQRLALSLFVATAFAIWRIATNDWLAAAVFLPMLLVPTTWLLFVVRKHGWSGHN